VQSLAELASTHSRLPWPEIQHLRRLTGSWGMLADFSFADLLLIAPLAGSDATRFVVLGQVRPTTGQTLYGDDLVGVLVDEERPLLGRAWRRGETVEGTAQAVDRDEPVDRLCVPVRLQGRSVAVLARDAPTTSTRRLGELERVYQEVFVRFAAMIAEGAYPFPGDDVEPKDAPRVGDGVIRIDADGRVLYMSPNAVSSLHRMGIHANPRGQRLTEIGFDDHAVRSASQLKAPVTEEVERGDSSLMLRAVPILSAGGVDGAVVLLRDVSELRRRDRMLLSKDATIREIHHRVKNNLQTIASLLRLQGRRLDSPEAKQALDESVRRIRSIAIVHETLAHSAGDVVDFAEIVAPMVRMVEDTVGGPDRSVHVEVSGVPGEFDSEIAMPLAVVLNELVQNAVDHAFDGMSSGHVSIRFDRTPEHLDLEVRDDGVGLPDGFVLERATGLGLQIVQTLVRTELNGSIAIRPDAGTVVEIRVPLAEAAD
jgi:two-component system, sensor histidine kinase PdtaS